MADHHVLLAPAYLVKDRGLGIETVTTLVHVSERHRAAHFDGARIGLLLIEHHLEECRLPSAVGSDDTDDATRRQEERQILDEQAIIEALGEMARVHDDVAEARSRRDHNLEAVRAPLRGFGLGHEFVKGTHAGLALTLTSSRGHSNPVEFSFERALTCFVRLLFGGEACLLLLQPRGVVALPRNTVTTIQFQDPRRGVVQEVAIVGDRDHGAGVVLEEALKPRDRFCVEVVRRFIEQEQVGLGEQEPTERHSTALATRQRAHVRVGRGKTQRVHGDLECAFKVPGPRGVDLGLQIGLLGEQCVEIRVRVGHRRAHFIETHEQIALLAHAVGDVAHYVLGLVELRFLREIAHAETRG